MPKLNTTPHDDRHDSQGKTIADILNYSEQPIDALLDFSICEGRKRPTQDSEAHPEGIPMAEVEQEPAAQRPSKTSSPRKPSMAPSGHDRRWTLQPN